MDFHLSENDQVPHENEEKFGTHESFSSKESDCITFFIVSDFGNVTKEVRCTAEAMNQYALSHGQPDFIAALGDNFYPNGPESVDDPMFEEIWREQFVRPYPALQVPWRMILGNHDYYGDPQAQVDYHYHSVHNADGLWYMPDRHYSFTVSSPCDTHEDATASSVSAEFYVMDTNGVELSVSTDHPTLLHSLQQDIQQLDRCLLSSTATWKIVFAHHPLYTAGWGHGRASRRLRSGESTKFLSREVPGFNLEPVLVRHHVDGYYSGHEHVFQAHTQDGVEHYCCGASGADIRPGHGLYRGKDEDTSIDWVAKGSDYGFVVVELRPTTMTTRFVSHNGSTLREFIRTQSADST